MRKSGGAYLKMDKKKEKFLLAMIRMMRKNAVRPVKLFHQHHAHQHMRPSHAPDFRTFEERVLTKLL